MLPFLILLSTFFGTSLAMKDRIATTIRGKQSVDNVDASCTLYVENKTEWHMEIYVKGLRKVIEPGLFFCKGDVSKIEGFFVPESDFPIPLYFRTNWFEITEYKPENKIVIRDITQKTLKKMVLEKIKIKKNDSREKN